MQTATATIGIRGSAFSLAYNPDGSLAVTTELDGIEVCTQAGCLGLTAGESAQVTAADVSPVRTNSKLSLPIPAPRREPQVIGDRTNNSGNSLVAVVNTPSATPPTNSPAPAPGPTSAPAPVAVAPAPIPAPGPAPATPPATAPVVVTPPAPPAPPAPPPFALTGWVYRSADLFASKSGEISNGFRTSNNGTLILSATGIPVRFSDGVAGSSTEQIATLSVGSGTHEIFTDTSNSPNFGAPFLVMGHRTPSVFSIGPNEQNSASTAFVSGIPATDNVLLTMSSTLPSARFNLAAGTPVFAQGGNGNGTLNSIGSYIDVDFSGVGNYVSVNLNMTFPGTAISGSDNVRLNGSTIATGGFNGGGNVFVGPARVTSAECANFNDNCGPGQINGFLTGPAGAATNVALAYGGSTANNGTFGGAAVFGGDPQPIASSDIGLNYNFYYGFTSQPGNAVSQNYDVAGGSPPNFIAGAGQDLQTYINTNAIVSLTRTSLTTGSRGSIGRYGDADFIGWGYWQQTNQTNTLFTALPPIPLKDLHFLTGSPATDLTSISGPSSVVGVVNYTPYANTIPTFTSGVSTYSGTLNSAQLSVDFTNIKVNASANTTFVITGTPYSQTTTSMNMPLNLQTGGFSSNPSDPNTIGSINGFLSGNRGVNGGFVYGSDVSLGGIAGNIRGVAVFRR